MQTLKEIAHMHEDEEEYPAEDFSFEGVFTDVFEAKIVPPKWVVENLFPVGLTFLVAPPKAGKSTLTMASAALVAGLPAKALPVWMSNVPRKGRALAFSAEAEAGELRHMLEHGMLIQGHANSSILISDDPWLFRLDDPPRHDQPSGWERMKIWLDTLKPRLVILDPLRDFHQADENDGGEMNRLLRPIRQWAMQNEAAFVVVHHTTKPKEGQTHYKSSDMRGTSALFGIADAAITCTPLEGKTNAIHIEAIFKKAKAYSADVQLAIYDSVDVRAGSLISDFEALTLFSLNAGLAKSVEELAQDLQRPQATIRKALAALERNKDITKEGAFWYQTETAAGTIANLGRTEADLRKKSKSP